MEKRENFSLLTPSYTKRLLFFMGADAFLFFISLHLAYALRFDFSIPQEYISTFYSLFLSLTVLKWASFYLFGMYRITWRFFGLQDAKKLFYAHILVFAGFFALYFLNPTIFAPIPRSVIGIDLILSLILVGGLRLSKRLLMESYTNKAHKPTIIIGISSNTARYWSKNCRI